MKKDKRRGVSLGSVVMIALTALVIGLCAVFLLAIVGEDVYERTGALIRSLSEQGLLGMDEETPAPSPSPGGATPDALAVPAMAIAGEATSAPAPQVSAFTLAASGTVCAPKAIRASAQDAAGGYDFTEIFAGLGDALSAADLSIVTLETTTAGEEKGYGSYSAPSQMLDALRERGVDFVSLATERALDKGYDALEITLRELNSRALSFAGVGDAGAQMLDIGGVRVAVLAYAYGLSDEGREQTGGDERGMLALIDAERMTRDIVSARLAGASVVIVLPHWGTKNTQETPQSVRALAQTLAEAGADIILGTHPNVVQGTERLRVTRSDGLEYEAVVCYSLGSLLTDARAPENTAGMVAYLTVAYDPTQRRAILGELACTPLYIASQREGGESVYRVVDVENAAAMDALTQDERAAAELAARTVREITGQSAREEEGQG